eukprot:63535_1
MSTSSNRKGKFRSVRTKEDKPLAKNKHVVDVSPPIRTHTHNAHQKYDAMVNTNSTTTSTNDYLSGSASSSAHSHSRNPSQSVMVRLKRLDTLRLNQRIKVKDYGYGSIQFLGCVHFAQGLFVGVELDEAKGKHDGSYHGKRYFTAKDKHGVLVKQHKVELLDIEDTTVTSQNNNNDSFSIINSMDLSKFADELFADDNELNNEDNGSDETDNNEEMNERLNELQRSNQALNHKIEEYIQTVDDLEMKISSLETENVELTQEKLHFENEMNTKIEELEQQLKQIHAQLQTKDEVLKKQISNHENTKNKFRKKIRQHEALKSKNQDTVQVILYGDNAKDEIIAQCRKKEKKYQMQNQQHILQIEHVDIQAKERLNQR